jgi:hypothetical protein
MNLWRFGKSALDPETIARIIDHQQTPDPGYGQTKDAVMVVFRDGHQQAFEGEDARALRRFVEGLPDGVAESSGAPDPPPRG